MADLYRPKYPPFRRSDRAIPLPTVARVWRIRQFGKIQPILRSRFGSTEKVVPLWLTLVGYVDGLHLPPCMRRRRLPFNLVLAFSSWLSISRGFCHRHAAPCMCPTIKLTPWSVCRSIWASSTPQCSKMQSMTSASVDEVILPTPISPRCQPAPCLGDERQPSWPLPATEGRA